MRLRFAQLHVAGIVDARILRFASSGSGEEAPPFRERALDQGLRYAVVL